VQLDPSHWPLDCVAVDPVPDPLCWPLDCVAVDPVPDPLCCWLKAALTGSINAMPTTMQIMIMCIFTLPLRVQLEVDYLWVSRVIRQIYPCGAA
jgi:hypothetical protein